ncbi:MAG: hypothetical protein ABIS20_14055 [Thermoanaerobaculia bacterium]
MAETPLELAYDSAVQALARQSTNLDELRARTGVLLAAASVSTAYLGSEALKGSHAGYFDWLAVVCFFGVGIMAVIILWPRSGWLFVVDAVSLIRDYIDLANPPELERIRRELALHFGYNYRYNQKRLDFLYWCVQLASFLLVVEIVAWLISLSEK